MAAVLQGEAEPALSGKSVGPGEEALVTLLVSGHGQLAEELSCRVFDRGGGVGVFVGIDPDRDQLRLLSFCGVLGWRSEGGRNWVGLLSGLLSGHAIGPLKRDGRHDPSGQPPQRRRDSAGSARRAEDARPVV